MYLRVSVTQYEVGSIGRTLNCICMNNKDLSHLSREEWNPPGTAAQVGEE